MYKYNEKTKLIICELIGFFSTILLIIPFFGVLYKCFSKYKVNINEFENIIRFKPFFVNKLSFSLFFIIYFFFLFLIINHIFKLKKVLKDMRQYFKEVFFRLCVIYTIVIFFMLRLLINYYQKYF